MDKLRDAVEESNIYNHDTRLSNLRPSYSGATHLAYNTCPELFNLRNTNPNKILYSDAYVPTSEGFFVAFWMIAIMETFLQSYIVLQRIMYLLED